MAFLEYQHLPGSLPSRWEELPFHMKIYNGHAMIPLHYHPYAEFTFVLHGSGYRLVNGIGHRLYSGIASLYLPHHAHEVHPNAQDSPRIYSCMFDFHLLSGSTLDNASLDFLYQVGRQLPSYVLLEDELQQQMNQTLVALHREYLRAPDAIGRTSMIRTKLIEALLLFLRGFNLSSAHNSNNARQQAPQLWDVLHFIHAHYMEKLTLSKISEELDVSPHYVRRILKEHAGMTFVDYVHHLRIESAARMLVSTNMSVTDVTFAAGFDSFRTFIRVFKERKGVTPTYFRNAIQAGGSLT